MWKLRGGTLLRRWKNVTGRASEPAAIKVLLIEDVPAFALALKADLERQPIKCRVQVVDWLSKALERLNEVTPDVVLTDLSLPDSQGLDTVVKLLSHFPSVPIVILTGEGDDQVGVEAIKLGVQDYIQKGNLDGRTVMRSLSYAIERARLRNELGQLIAQRDDFMAVIAHDLKNNLLGIRTVMGALLSKPASLSTELLSTMMIVQRACEDSLLMTNDLLEIYRQQSGEEPFLLESRDLRDVVAKAISEISDHAKAKFVDVQVVPNAVPVMADCDQAAFGHVLINLLHNAIKFSPPGSKVRVSVEAGPTEALVKVIDEGHGISEEEQKDLFIRFKQGRLGKMHPGGSGLGLFLSYRIVELHNGRLSYERDAENRTVFVVQLPLKQAQPANLEESFV